MGGVAIALRQAPRPEKTYTWGRVPEPQPDVGSTANSYAVLAPVLALIAWWHFSHGARGVGGVLAAMVLSMGLLPEPLRPLFGNSFSLAWYPAMALGFVGVLVWTVFGPRPAQTPAGGGTT